MRYVIALLLVAVVGVAGYVGGYADASRQWYTINRSLGRMGELDRADHLLRFVELIDNGDPSGARLRMVAVASVMVHSDTTRH